MCRRKRILPAQLDHQADGFEFSFVGARGEIGGVAAPVGVAQGLGSGVDGAGEFGVDQQGEFGFGDGG